MSAVFKGKNGVADLQTVDGETTPRLGRSVLKVGNDRVVDVFLLLPCGSREV